MTAKEMASVLNGAQYGNEITRDEERIAKESGLVVVFGYSDDCAEFRGAIDDEAGCYDGGIIRLTKAGLLAVPDCREADCKYYKAATKDAATIEAVWCDKESGAAWSYKTAIPHETFNVYEDGDLYCVGIVFSMEDLK